MGEKQKQMGLLDFLFGRKLNFRDLKKEGAIILDVRTPEEFALGHIEGSKNIPLDKLSLHVGELKAQGKPVIACCRSGARSAAAVSKLKAHGIKAYNGGPWTSLKEKV